MFEKILICLDGSSLAEQILPYAVEQSRCFGSKVVILQVIATEMLSVGPGDPQLAIEKLDKALKEEKDANAYVRRIARRLRSRGLAVEYVVQKGNASETIVAYAKINGIGLIAMGTHGHSGMGRIIFGSVAEYVVRESGLPVLMIKPK